MAKGDDVARRKKNKASRKKLSKDSSLTVSARVASIIAAKKRRKSGKRSQCQGMCFSLPTPDDPFNDLLGKKDDFNKKEIKKGMPARAAKRDFLKGLNISSQNGNLGQNGVKVDHMKHKDEKIAILKEKNKSSLPDIDNVHRGSTEDFGTKIQPNGKCGNHGLQREVCENSDRPSKFLILCLNAIENALRQDCFYSSDEGKPLFFDTWGVEFWKCYSVGKDVLDTSGSCSTVEQIAWMVSSAADTITRKEKEGLSFSSPFLLFLVPTQEKAIKVRSVCKPLKALGIHTVSIHSGASLDHQIQGLKSCEPEFLVSTPERLWELVSMKAVDISGVSMLVVDGLESLSRDGYLDATKFIRQSLSGNPHTVVFNACFSRTLVPVVQNLMRGSVFRLSLHDSIASQSACIMQSINCCTTEEEKRSKVIQALGHIYENRPKLTEVLCIVEKDSKSHKLVTALKLKGYSISAGSTDNVTDFNNSSECDTRKRPAVSIIDTHHITKADLEKFQVVFILNSGLSVDDYIQILTRMARCSIDGVLQSFITEKEAPLVAPLIDILDQCSQEVPATLRDLCLKSGMSEC